jgi:serine/threonine-protein kinase
MGIVMAAHHLGLDTKVAIKLLLPEVLGHEDVVARFAREARAAAKIKSEHVARVFDVGTLEDGSPYLVMEFLDGIDLHGWMEREGVLGVEQAVDFLLQASVAVAEAHELGIVHRDLKPANLFCVRRAEGTFIKVLDFGISKMKTDAGNSSLKAAMTRTAALMGTPFYMSPEQMDSARDVDGRSDVWSLGVILFELMSGSLPFAGTTLPEVCIKIATQPPAGIRALRPEVPEGLEAVIFKCLEKDRDKRFASVGEFAAALAPFAPARSGHAVERLTRTLDCPPTRAGSQVVPLPAWKGDTHGPETLDAVGRTQHAAVWRSAGRRKILLQFAAATVGLCALVSIIVAMADRPPTSTEANAARTAGAASATASSPGVPVTLAPAPAADPVAPSASESPGGSRVAETLPAATRDERPMDDVRDGPKGGHGKALSAAPAAAPKPTTDAQTAHAATPSRPTPALEAPNNPNPYDERL